MQTANIMLALGGSMGNTVQKFGVTPSEIAVLREIHGEAAVFDIDPQEDVERNSREERSRLHEVYGKPPGSRELSAVDVLFPGVASRLFETLDELEIDQSFFKATERARPKAATKAKPSPEPDEVEAEAPAPKKTEKTAPAKKKSLFAK